MTPQDSPPDTNAQKALQDHISNFRRREVYAAQFLSFLKRSEVGLWRVERATHRGQYWLHITLPKHHQDIFDLHREILVLYTEYEHVEPRALSNVQKRVRSDMRVEGDVAMLVSRDPRAKSMASRQAGELAVIPINLDDIATHPDKLLYSHIADSVASVDHYNVSTPIRDSKNLFGRRDEIDSIANILKDSRSVGIFGLRKAGKTSLLNAIEAIRSDDPELATAKIDLSGVVSAEQFRSEILESVWESLKGPAGTTLMKSKFSTLARTGLRRKDIHDSSTHWTRDLRSLISLSPKPVLLIIDEIDQSYPPRSNLEPNEARLLYQSLVQLRSILQEQDRLVLLAAGVDPALFEQPIIDARDNLLYKLVHLHWLAPLDREEMAKMVRSLGRRMGVRIRSHTVIDALFESFGGHPLLTRKACSLAVKSRSSQHLPFHLDEEHLREALDSQEYSGPRDESVDLLLSFREWHPAEMSFLELVFSSDAEERELGISLLEESPNSIAHAIAYGLCFDDGSARIHFAMDQIGSLRDAR
ncbi:hypothetical protein ACFU1Q_08915 [Brachybacterium paraconglomeratum]